MSKKKYEDEAIKLSKVIDIAIDSFEKFNVENKDWFIKVYSEWKERILNPEIKFKTIASLKYDIADVFTMFNESTGKEIEYFWEQIKMQNLEYKREDKLNKILNRGKIRGKIEFDYITDIIVPAEQENRITKVEAKKLGEMLYEFEFKKKK
jgi:hypothetical protein|tara:strand:+ start:49 stop:501 length:453 start_codon:yes stop_codon:yes gene_type:complete